MGTVKPSKCRKPCNGKLELYSHDEAYQEKSWLCKKCGSLYLDAYGPKSPSFKKQQKSGKARKL